MQKCRISRKGVRSGGRRGFAAGKGGGGEGGGGVKVLPILYFIVYIILLCRRCWWIMVLYYGWRALGYVHHIENNLLHLTVVTKGLFKKSIFP